MAKQNTTTFSLPALTSTPQLQPPSAILKRDSPAWAAGLEEKASDETESEGKVSSSSACDSLPLAAVGERGGAGELPGHWQQAGRQAGRSASSSHEARSAR